MAWRMLWHDLSPGEATLGINPTRETVCLSPVNLLSSPPQARGFRGEMDLHARAAPPWEPTRLLDMILLTRHLGGHQVHVESSS